MSYIVKYAVVPSKQINNILKPDEARIKQMEKECQFFSKLEKSILNQGFRNPIVITANSKIDIQSRYGGSRLMFAQKHDLNIPCIIADFDNVFPDAEVLDNVDEIRKHFIDQPAKIYYKPHGVNMSGCEHVHLKEDDNAWTYTARYIVIPSNLIFNECGPQSAGPRGWDENRVAKRKIASQNYIDTLNRRNGFYDKLEESILKEGIRNPVLVAAGWCPVSKISRLPPEMQEDHSKILVCHSSGGSRLWAAQKHNLDVPCIVSDFINRFPEGKILRTEQDVLDCHKDKPRKITIGEHGVFVSDLPQTHMEKNK